MENVDLQNHLSLKKIENDIKSNVNPTDLMEDCCGAWWITDVECLIEAVKPVLIRLAGGHGSIRQGPGVCLKMQGIGPKEGRG